MLLRILQLLLVGLLVPALAFAEGPRDAVRELPQFTHRSEFRIIESDLENGLSNRDEYNGYWEINWQPRSIRLGSDVEINPRLYYKLALSDFQDKRSSTSADVRQDNYEFSTEIRKPQDWRLFYKLLQRDTFNGRTGSERSWRSEHESSFNADLTRSGLPELRIYGNSRKNYGMLGTQQTDSSAVDYLQARLEHRRSTALHSEKYAFSFESAESASYQPNSPIRNPGGIEQTKLAATASRQFPLASAGTLNIDFSMEETTSKDFPGLDPTVDRQSVYSIGWFGEFRPSPLRYSYSIRNAQNQAGETPTQTIFQRRFNLVLAPAVPSGKAASLSMTIDSTDEDSANVQRSIDRQQIEWSFMANPRFGGNMVYSASSSTDRLLELRSEEQEEVNSRLFYAIPGERGRLSTLLTERTIRNPQNESSNSFSYIEFNNQLRLGSNSSLEFFLNQSYNDFQDGPLLPVSSNETLYSGVGYSIASPNGLSLNARIGNQLIFFDSGTEHDSQTMNIILKYKPMPGWNYQVVFDSNDQARIPINSARIYETNSVINATVTYSF